MFNKKFEGKYKDVKRPIICNGLKAIKPFTNDKGLKETEEDEEVEEDEESLVIKEKITIQNNESGDVENLISN